MILWILLWDEIVYLDDDEVEKLMDRGVELEEVLEEDNAEDWENEGGSTVPVVNENIDDAKDEDSDEE